MLKCNIYRLLVILILSIPSKVGAQQVLLLKTSYFPAYPSASTLSYSNDRLYVMGDDATHLLVLDKNHKAVDSLRIFDGSQQRLAKDTKADIEASAVLQKEGETFLFLFSSYSGRTRNKIYRIGIAGNAIKRDLKHLSRQPKTGIIKEWNIEGATFAGDKLILSNRANNTNKNNYLLVLNANTKKGFKKRAKAVQVTMPATQNVVGISGLTYLPTNDLLLLTATTEITDNAYTDGEIGDSFLGYITNFSKKTNGATIAVDALLNLTAVLQQKSAQKIESVAVEAVTGNNALLHLAADNDNGESTLFKIRLTLPAK